MKRTSVMTLSLLVIVALAGMSLAYTYWTQDLQINGSVSTGKLELQFDSATPSEVDPLDSATCIVSGTPGTTLTVTVSNAYPGYSCQITDVIKNTGTIPAELESVSVSGVPTWANVTLGGSNVCTADQAGNQLAVDATADCTVTVAVPTSVGDTDENKSGSFTVVYSFEQPNED